jgi:hypothetical protein
LTFQSYPIKNEGYNEEGHQKGGEWNKEEEMKKGSSNNESSKKQPT